MLVQGAEAPGQIVKALQAFNALQEADVLIIGRGGGSIEELWAFNDEQVVRAIAASRIPVVSAVGHETDYTLADFVADRRAATPSQAAELVTPDVQELNRRINALRAAITNNIRYLIGAKKQQHSRLRENPALARPKTLLAARQQQLDQYCQRLTEAIQRQQTARRQELERVAEKLALLNPWSVLSRGYSIVRTADQALVTDASRLSPGQTLEIIPRKGMIYANIIAIKEANPDAPNQ